MQAGLNLYSIRNKIGTEEDFLATAQKLKDMGYDYLQYSGAAFDADRIKRVTEQVGIPVNLTHVAQSRIIDDPQTLMEEHAKFGCNYIGLGCISPADILDEKKTKDIIDKLNRSAELMQKSGFQFFYHHHQFDFFRYESGDTPFDYMVKNAPYIHFIIDTYWLQMGGMDIAAKMRSVAGRMECVHFKDWKNTYTVKEGTPNPDFHPVFTSVGDGTFDFKAIKKVAEECGAKYFYVEQDNAADAPDPFEPVKRSITYIKNNL